MNLWQAAQQVKYLLEQRDWDGDAANERVFASGCVIISSLPIYDIITMSSRYPLAIVRPGAQTLDPEFPEIVLGAELSVEIAQRVANDRFAESAFTGGSVPSLGASQGRGVGDILGEVQSVIQQLDRANGIRVVGRSPSASSMVDSGHVQLVTMGLDMVIKCGTQPTYDRASNFDETSSNVLTWTLPPDRFDRVGVVLRYNPGISGVTPQTPTEGTGATLSSDTATTYTHTAGAGAFSYALFGAYDTNGDGTADAFSPLVEYRGVFS